MASETSYSHALPLGYVIGAYKIEGYLGEGGFGITYLARHTRLQDQVAIKEYFPSEFSVRDQSSIVTPKTQAQQDTYAWGLERFLDEAKTLIRFKHPHIIAVRDYFEMNGTGYIVMNYEIGQTFKQWTKTQFDETHEHPSEKKLLDIIIPILDALEVIHAEKFLHRDIKPDNIYIRSDGTPILIDFGASRQALGDRSQSLSTILSPGYAPKEQYSSRGTFGPWTDLYAIGATLYFAIAAQKPPSSTDRGNARDEGDNDPLIPAEVVGKDKYSQRFLQAIDHCLAYLPKDRPQTAKELKLALSDIHEETTVGGPKGTKTATDKTKAESKKETHFGRQLLKLAGVVIVVAIGVAITPILHERMESFKSISMAEPEKKVVSNKQEEPEQILSPAKQSKPESKTKEARVGLESDDKDQQQAAIKILTELADGGDADAMHLLGAGYYLGVGVKQDYKKGCRWYKKAAQEGNKRAEEMYEKFTHCN